ncbi:MAG: PAS domain-containing protein [Acidobacteria bacterium]|nr:PAS domain-containing protein [Acidobacteriota bacterium]
MDGFNMKVLVAWGFFLAFVIISIYIIIIKKLKKVVRGEEEREAPDFVLENIRHTLDQRNALFRELEIREKLNEIILNNLAIGVAVFDKFKILKSANPMFRRLFHLPEEKLNQSIVQFQEESPELFQFVRQLKDTGTGKEQEEQTTVRGRIIKLHSTPVSELLGNKGGYLLLAEDITDIEAAKSQLELKKRLEIIGEMSAGLAHEFKNSLSTLKGYAQMIENESQSGIIGKYTARILSEVEDINGVVNQFLLYAKPLQPEIETVPVSSFREEILNSFPDLKNIIEITVTPETLTIKTDRTLLKQCLINLIRNSLEHLKNDGIIRISVENEKTGIRITVRDNGIGMDRETLERARVPFFTTRKDGTGLGLAICEKIVSRLGGKMTIDSAPDVGTTVEILL